MVLSIRKNAQLPTALRMAAMQTVHSRYYNKGMINLRLF